MVNNNIDRKIEDKNKNKSINIKNKFYKKEFETSFEIIGKILSSPNKKKILLSLNMPRTITQISKLTNIDLANISRAVRELEDINLIKINNKNKYKGKIISITNKGITLINDLYKL